MDQGPLPSVKEGELPDEGILDRAIVDSILGGI